jgi:hypothetical protein
MRTKRELIDEIRTLYDEQVDSGYDPVIIMWRESSILELFYHRESWEDYRRGLEDHNGDLSNHIKFLDPTEMDDTTVLGTIVHEE